MYSDAPTFLTAERAAWEPYLVLAELTDEQLSSPVPGAHGWSGRDLMGHFVVWHEKYPTFVAEMLSHGHSESKAADDAHWDQRGEGLNDEYAAAFAEVPMAELRARFARAFDTLREQVAPISAENWQGNLDEFLPDVTIGHYAGHRQDLVAILAAARGE